MTLSRRRRCRWHVPTRHERTLRDLQRRAEAMTRGDFTSLGQPVGGAPAIEDLRRAIDVMGAHIEQAQQGMHAYIAALTTAQEAERSRLARELHDDTVQQLIALGQGIERAQRTVPRDAALAVERLSVLRRDVTTLVQTVRTVIADLRPPALDDLGLIPAVELLVGRNGDDEPQVAIDVIGQPRRLDMQSELAVFRIIQEAWSNIRRHAAATMVQLQFAYLRNSVMVTIHDNGRGFVVPQNGPVRQGGWGLIGMRERAAVVGATIALHSQPGHGTRLEVRVPYLGLEGRDPVCGMEVGPDALNIEYGDQLYRFCSPACADLFRAHPDRYLAPGAAIRAE